MPQICLYYSQDRYGARPENSQQIFNAGAQYGWMSLLQIIRHAHFREASPPAGCFRGAKKQRKLYRHEKNM